MASLICTSPALAVPTEVGQEPRCMERRPWAQATWPPAVTWPPPGVQWEEDRGEGRRNEDPRVSAVPCSVCPCSQTRTLCICCPSLAYALDLGPLFLTLKAGLCWALQGGCRAHGHLPQPLLAYLTLRGCLCPASQLGDPEQPGLLAQVAPTTEPPLPRCTLHTFSFLGCSGKYFIWI